MSELAANAQDLGQWQTIRDLVGTIKFSVIGNPVCA